MEEPTCPECEKMAKVRDQSQKIGEFLEWLRGEKEIVFCTYHQHSKSCYDNEEDYEDHKYARCGYREDDLAPAPIRTEEILAEFFDIDLDKIEQERRALLEYCRERNHCCEQKKK